MPKVLIFGQSFNANTGGGVTLTNLFGDWDKDDLAVICTSHANGNISPNVCDNYYFIGSDEFHYKFPFNYFQRPSPSGKLPIVYTTTNESFSYKPGWRELIIQNVLYPMLDWSGLMHVISKMEVSANLLKWVDEFSPDILYIQASTRESLLFAIKLSEKIKVPVIIHQMDDWVSTVGSNGLGSRYWNRKINGEFKQLVQRADLCLSISDLMGSEYQRRYGSKFKTFHNPVDLDIWEPKANVEKYAEKECSILYAGRTGFGIATSLKAFASAVERFNETSDIKIKFYIQTAEELAWTQDFQHTIHRKLIPYDKLPQLFQSMDFLLLPCDFSDKALKFLKYSMPTKAPEYMITGTPIIILAPEETAIFQYGKEYNWAFTISDDDPDFLYKRLKEIVSNTEAKWEISQNALKLAKARHSRKVVIKEFTQEFQKLLEEEEQCDYVSF
ncbi:glycosyltransferase involved in cell wall biosynthesis [Algoriphagus sp. 4150]|uniref:group 1 glycosyl transferase n=1 Tax=Algoriphagus sp. 4150 TaxID=2817756 RepID=UPI002854B275|nr:group 1 glycosyl transferase [Algoriphagus sp. 4150]MDR7131767.1 glycosyltransferase involved in cell wall biosynthesis [Algoriphagus sp. 4150]